MLPRDHVNSWVFKIPFRPQNTHDFLHTNPFEIGTYLQHLVNISPSPGKVLSQWHLFLEPHKLRKQSDRSLCTSRRLLAPPSEGVSSPDSVQARSLPRLGTGAQQGLKESNPAPSWDIAQSSLSSLHSAGQVLQKQQDTENSDKGSEKADRTPGRGESQIPVQSDDHKPACTVGFLSLCFAQTKRPETLDLLNILHRKCCCHYRLSL